MIQPRSRYSALAATATAVTVVLAGVGFAHAQEDGAPAKPSEAVNKVGTAVKDGVNGFFGKVFGNKTDRANAPAERAAPQAKGSIIDVPKAQRLIMKTTTRPVVYCESNDDYTFAGKKPGTNTYSAFAADGRTPIVMVGYEGIQQSANSTQVDVASVTLDALNNKTCDKLLAGGKLVTHIDPRAGVNTPGATPAAQTAGAERYVVYDAGGACPIEEDTHTGAKTLHQNSVVLRGMSEAQRVNYCLSRNQGKGFTDARPFREMKSLSRE
jgi:hypothetical protein